MKILLAAALSLAILFPAGASAKEGGWPFEIRGEAGPTLFIRNNQRAWGIVGSLEVAYHFSPRFYVAAGGRLRRYAFDAATFEALFDYQESVDNKFRLWGGTKGDITEGSTPILITGTYLLRAGCLIPIGPAQFDFSIGWERGKAWFDLRVDSSSGPKDLSVEESYWNVQMSALWRIPLALLTGRSLNNHGPPKWFLGIGATIQLFHAQFMLELSYRFFDL